jgi:succinyl-diaminopimelate desuccinylase
VTGGAAGTEALSHAERLAATLLWLCEIPSPIGDEKALCDAVVDRLERGPATLAGPIRRFGDSIVVPVTRATKPGGPRIALVGHLDVVRTSHDGPPRREGDLVYGPGASDMKSGLALMLDLVEHDLAACAGVDLTLVFYAREEGPYLENELGPVLEADPELAHVDLAVCLEPSDNKLSLGASGSIQALITFEGRTAHSARPWQGENAIHKAGPFLTELGALGPRDTVIDGLVYRTVTSCTLAQGGRGRNIVPDAFELNLNHRFSPAQTIAEAQAEIEALVAGRARIAWRDLSPAGGGAAGGGRRRRRAQAGVDGRGPLRCHRGAGRELRPGDQRPGAPAQRAHVGGQARGGARDPAPVALRAGVRAGVSAGVRVERAPREL